MIEIQDIGTDDDLNYIKTTRMVRLEDGSAGPLEVVNGTIFIEFERDSYGKIVRDTKGAPVVARSLGGKLKIGPVLLEWDDEAFTRDGQTFGAWVASGGSGDGYRIVSPYGFCAEDG